MKHPVKNNDLEKRVFAASEADFNDLTLEIFRFQYSNNAVYQQYCDILNINVSEINDLSKIPYLPIGLFKTHQVTTTLFAPETIFESSGTTASGNSQHFIKDIHLYKKSFNLCFNKFYGNAKDKCILGLLPSYLERSNSSLVYMVSELINESENRLSGFYLNNLDKLHSTILHNEILKQSTLLIGVTYALLEFAEIYTMNLRHTIIMETGGMKGRRKEITRQNVHQQLQKSLGVSLIHSEYGMTELLSQAYSKGDGIFHCPQWLKVAIRDDDDPFKLTFSQNVINKPVTGVINIIDLANIYSCSFIATDDIGRLHSNGSFEVLGRLDNSDLRGCSLLTV